MKIALTGPRPNGLGGEYGQYSYSEYGPYSEWLFDTLRDVLNGILDRIYSGHTTGLCGMAQGSDTIWAELLIAMNIPIHAVIPFAGQELRWPIRDREKYHDILRVATRTTNMSSVSMGYSRGIYHVRNKWMVDNSDLLMAVSDGSPGGSLSTLKYALYSQRNSRKTDFHIIIINPKTKKVSYEYCKYPYCPTSYILGSSTRSESTITPAEPGIYWSDHDSFYNANTGTLPLTDNGRVQASHEEGTRNEEAETPPPYPIHWRGPRTIGLEVNPERDDTTPGRIDEFSLLPLSPSLFTRSPIEQLSPLTMPMPTQDVNGNWVYTILPADLVELNAQIRESAVEPHIDVSDEAIQEEINNYHNRNYYNRLHGGPGQP